jgi:hypothetical protein
MYRVLELAIVTILLTCSTLALGEIYYPLEEYAIYSFSLGKVAEDTWCMALLAAAIYIAAILMFRTHSVQIYPQHTLPI